MNALVNEERTKLATASQLLLKSLQANSTALFDICKDLMLQDYLESHVIIADLIRRTSGGAFLFPALALAHSSEGVRPFCDVVTHSHRSRLLQRWKRAA